MSETIDDKSSIVIPFILSRLKQHRAQHDTPFFIGLNGVQGVGKTTLVTTLADTLSKPPHRLRTLTFSIDDLYLPRAEQEALAAAHPNNPLVQHRGQPSTHDVTLGTHLFKAIAALQENVHIPSYDKSAHSGAGDRVPREKWNVVNKPREKPMEVVIFEGWCVGFRALSGQQVETKWREAVSVEEKRKAASEPPLGRLGYNRLEDVQYINDALRSYDSLTDMLDAFVVLDAEDTHYVYDWRLEQEQKMREEKGQGMSNEQVRKFVDGYYPAYELFSETLRQGALEERGRQLRLVIAKDRKVMHDEVT